MDKMNIANDSYQKTYAPDHGQLSDPIIQYSNNLTRDRNESAKKQQDTVLNVDLSHQFESEYARDLMQQSKMTSMAGKKNRYQNLP